MQRLWEARDDGSQDAGEPAWDAGYLEATGDPEEQIKNIRKTAITRETKKRASDKKLQRFIDGLGESDKGGGNMLSEYQRDNLTRRGMPLHVWWDMPSRDLD
jgi:hypothetical protein